MALLRSIVTIGGLTAISRVFGFVRDVLIAAFLGAGFVADAFFVALRLPNLFRSLFAEGAFSAAFVPTYVTTLETEGKLAAWRFAREAGTFLGILLFLFVVAGELAMPLVVTWLAPGFVGGQTFELAVTFSRITFPYILFMSMAALLAGLLNSHERFAAAAATPILLNLCMIGGLLIFGPAMPTYGHALAWGLAIAGVIQLAWLYGHCAAMGDWFTFVRPRASPQVRIMLRRALPVAFGAGIYQINVLVGTILASLLPVGSVSYLFYADRVAQLPFGVIGIAVSTALLPTLTRQLSGGDNDAAMESLNRALEFAFLLMLPATAALIVISHPIISVLFERGAFGPAEVTATSPALAAFAVGLPALLVLKALSSAFFARGDTKTPVKAALAAAIANVALSIALMQVLSHVGIALAASTAVTINAVILFVVLYRRGHLVIDRRLKTRLPRTAAATTGMALALYFIAISLDPWLTGGVTERILGLIALIVAGAITYAGLVHSLRAARFSELRAILGRSGAA